MRRRRRRRSLGRRIVIGGVLALLAAGTALIVARVTVLEMVIDTALEASGFTDARYRIASIGFSSARLTDIQLGHEIAIKELALNYRPWRLTQLALEEVVITGLRLDLTGMGTASPGPLARMLEGNGKPSEGAPSGLPSVPPLQIADGVLRLPGEVTVTLDDASWAPVDDGVAYSLDVTNVRLARLEQQAALRDVTARIAADFRQTEGLITRFTVGALSHESAEPVVAPFALEGAVESDADVWRFKGTATGAGATQVTLVGSYDWASQAADGRVTVPEIRFAPGGLQPSDIVPPLASLTSVTGALAGHAAMRWKAGRASLDGALRLADLGFTVAGVSIDDLTARLALSSDAQAQPVLRIEEARMAMAGGLMQADPATLRPLADSNQLVLRIDGVDLARVLATFEIDGVSGEGKISGRVPIVLSDSAVAVDAGKLEAQGPGVLRITSPGAASALAAGGADTNLLLQALADFRYDRLALTVDKPLSGESRLTLTTFGHNPAVLDGHPFQINVTVTTNLDKILGVIAEGGRLSQEIIRAIVGAR